MCLPFLAALLVLNVSSVWNKSPTTDEPYHLDFGMRVLTSPEVRADMQRMPITAINALPLALMERTGIDLSSRTEWFVARLPTVALSLVLAILVFQWSRELWGWQGALLSLALYTFSPNVLGHSRWATGDMATALFFFASLRAFVGYLKAPSYGRLLRCGVWTGLAQVAKHSSLLLFPLLVATWAVDALRRTTESEAGHSGSGRGELLRRRVRSDLAPAVALGLVTLLVINAGYGFKGSLVPVSGYLASFQEEGDDVTGDPRLERIASLVEPFSALPVPVPFAYLEALLLGMHYTAYGKGHGPNYLFERVDQQGWWYYYLATLVLKVPLALYVLIALSLPAMWRGWRRLVVEDVLFALVVVSVVAFFSVTSSAQIGVRYLLPMFPFIFVSLGRLAAHFGQRARWFQGTVIVSTLWFVISCLSFHPHYLSYFNELIGDRKNMYLYLADSNVDWNQNNHHLTDYLGRHAGQPIAVNPMGPATGTVIVAINELVGVKVDRESYAWLRDAYEPVDQIGYSWLVFEVKAAPGP